MIDRNVICDICKKEAQYEDKEIQVIFTTEQTEGRGVEPYLSNQKVDICDKCLAKILSTGQYVFGNGAQGYNNYYFKETKHSYSTEEEYNNIRIMDGEEEKAERGIL